MRDATILVVDDDPQIRDVLRVALERAEFRVEAASDGAAGLAQLEAVGPDLAILDIMGVNGFELLKLCVEKEIPAVMLTAHAFSVESLKKSLDLGASAYLPKEKMADIVTFLEDVVTLEHKENWERLFKRLGTFLNATWGGKWNKDLIEIGPFIVPGE